MLNDAYATDIVEEVQNKQYHVKNEKYHFVLKDEEVYFDLGQTN